MRSFVSVGTRFKLVRQPSDKSLGYFRASLREAESRHAKHVLGRCPRFNMGRAFGPRRSATRHLFSVVELVAPRRVAARAAAQGLTANRSMRANRSAAARGGVVAARQPLPLTIRTNQICNKCAGFFRHVWARLLVGLRSKTSLYTYATRNGQRYCRCKSSTLHGTGVAPCESCLRHTGETPVPLW